MPERIKPSVETFNFLIRSLKVCYSLNSGLARASVVRLPGWSPWGLPKWQLEITSDTARCRSHCCYIRNLF